jgi:two-component system CheB/CheR fusion protein
LKALEEFFDNCPSDTGFAFVIVQHLSPHYKSLMPELLSRHTEMTVKEAKEGDIVAPIDQKLPHNNNFISGCRRKISLANKLPWGKPARY